VEDIAYHPLHQQHAEIHSLDNSHHEVATWIFHMTPEGEGEGNLADPLVDNLSHQAQD
jgi:hypothetical protein